VTEMDKGLDDLRTEAQRKSAAVPRRRSKQ